MTQQQIVLIVLAAVIILAGIFLAVKGKPSMIRERFASGAGLVVFVAIILIGQKYYRR